MTDELSRLIYLFSSDHVASTLLIWIFWLFFLLLPCLVVNVPSTLENDTSDRATPYALEAGNHNFLCSCFISSFLCAKKAEQAALKFSSFSSLACSSSPFSIPPRVMGEEKTSENWDIEIFSTTMAKVGDEEKENIRDNGEFIIIERRLRSHQDDDGRTQETREPDRTRFQF